MYIDTHAHLLDPRFDVDRDAVIGRAAELGVGSIIEIGCDPDGWQTVLAFCERRGARCVLGIHPQDAQRSSDDLLTALEDLARRPDVVGIGETGLDYHFENSPRAVQKDVFEKTLDIAQRAGKPVVIHCREAYPDLLALLAARRTLPRGVVHCFSGTPEEALRLVDRGFLLGIDGPVTYPKNAALKAVVRQVPLEKIVLETDSPYLPPQEHRGERNEPSYLPRIAAEVAALKDVPVEEVARVTSAAAAALFGLKG